MKRVLLFPNSPYLQDKWWQRLVTVIFWVWLTTVVLRNLREARRRLGR